MEAREWFTPSTDGYTCEVWSDEGWELVTHGNSQEHARQLAIDALRLTSKEVATLFPCDKDL